MTIDWITLAEIVLEVLRGFLMLLIAAGVPVWLWCKKQEQQEQRQPPTAENRDDPAAQLFRGVAAAEVLRQAAPEREGSGIGALLSQLSLEEQACICRRLAQVIEEL